MAFLKINNLNCEIRIPYSFYIILFQHVKRKDVWKIDRLFWKYRTNITEIVEQELIERRPYEKRLE